jgi:catechol 2,3-dioxygenase-like lactoylglutathione lyase family enzyme
MRDVNTRMVLAIPALPVRDMTRSVAFYREQLGFTVRHEDAGFAILQRDAVELHLWEASDENWQGRSGTSPVISGAESFIAGTASCRIQVTGVDDLHGELQPRGILHPNAQLADQPWGTREFGVLDLDNNLITFFERV